MSDADKARGAIKAAALQAAGAGGHGLRHLSSSALLSFLCAAAFCPLIVASAGVDGLPGAGFGVLSTVGGGVLGGVLTEWVERLRGNDDRQAVDVADLAEEIGRQMEQILAAGDSNARALRSEIAAAMRDIGAEQALLQAACETNSELSRLEIISAIEALSSGVAGLAFQISDVAATAAEMQRSLDELNAEKRAESELIAQQAVQIRLVREDVAAFARKIGSATTGSPSESALVSHFLSTCPYKGLVPFSETDAEAFYGRGVLTTQLAVKVTQHLTQGGLIVVTGASGAGKSSLLRAGLLPVLASGRQVPGSAQWPVIVMTPTKDPLMELATRLAIVCQTESTAIRDRLAERPDEAQILAREAVLYDTARKGIEYPATHDDSARLILIVDQFEQVFTLTPGAEGESVRLAFVMALRAMASNSAGPNSLPPAIVIVAVRGDFWDQCAAYAELASEQQKGQFIVSPMDESDLRHAIYGPAEMAGLKIDPNLAETILSDLRLASGGDGIGALPLLSQTMLLTWENRDGNRLTGRGYEMTGGVGHVVQTSADSVYDELSVEQRPLAQTILRSMTVVSGSGRLASRPVALTDLYDTCRTDRSEVDAVLDRFVKKRLLTLDVNSAQVAHETLIDRWPLLEKWVAPDRAFQLWLRRVRDLADSWEAQEFDSDILLRGQPLRQAVSWCLDRRDATDSVTKSFVACSCSHKVDSLAAEAFLFPGPIKRVEINNTLGYANSICCEIAEAKRRRRTEVMLLREEIHLRGLWSPTIAFKRWRETRAMRRDPANADIESSVRVDRSDLIAMFGSLGVIIIVGWGITGYLTVTSIIDREYLQVSAIAAAIATATVLLICFQDQFLGTAISIPFVFLVALIPSTFIPTSDLGLRILGDFMPTLLLLGCLSMQQLIRIQWRKATQLIREREEMLPTEAGSGGP
jgi:energy-coupling factor transporter ATP-binding protein EcfA2